MNLVCRLMLVAACVAGTTFSGPAVAADDAWKPVASDRGIEIYRRTVGGGNLVALKGVGVIDAPLWKIASILLDTKRAPEWADSLKESRVLRRLGPTAYIEYNHIGLPFIIKDRDFVSEVQIEVDAAARTFALVYRPAADETPPATRNVRGEIVAGRFEAVSLESGARTRLTAEMQADPKGLLPTWLVNLFQRNWPVTTFERLRAQATKPDIEMPVEFRDVLAKITTF
jgi:hypothetical protein